MKKRYRETSDQNGGGDRDAAEQHHQPDMQLGPSRTAPPFHPHPRQAHGQHRAQQQQQRQIAQHQGHTDARLQPQRGATSEDDEGCDPHRQR